MFSNLSKVIQLIPNQTKTFLATAVVLSVGSTLGSLQVLFSLLMHKPQLSQNLSGRDPGMYAHMCVYSFTALSGDSN